MSSRSAARDLLLAQWNLRFAYHINVKAGHSISLAPAPRCHWHKTLKHVIPSNARDLLFTLWNHNRGPHHERGEPVRPLAPNSPFWVKIPARAVDAAPGSLKGSSCHRSHRKFYAVR